MKWVPVSERLPEQNVPTLVWQACFDEEDFPVHSWFCGCGCGKFVNLENDPMVELDDVTHWLEWEMP